MMKKLPILLFSLSAFCAGAQNVKLAAGKKITGITKSTVNMDMGAMGGEMKMESEAVSDITVTGSDNDSYKVNATVTKMKMSVDASGQNIAYDSDNKSDTSSEMVKEVSKMINNPIALLINKKDGTVKSMSPEKPGAEDESNPLNSLMTRAQSAEGATGAAFFVIPAGKKTGDKWVDSSSENGLKAIKTFELQSIKNGIAIIGVNSVTTGHMQKTAEGMDVEMSLDGTSVSTMTVDTSTGLVQRVTTTGNMSGTMDLAGQSLPITMAVNSEYNFQ